MINIYDDVLAHPEYFKQFAVGDVLFVHYKCPQKEDLVHLLTHHNYLIYSLDGERRLIRGNEKWLLTKDMSVFVKPSAYSQEWYQQEDWEVICFFIPDEYLKKFINEYRAMLPAARLSACSRESLINVHVNSITRAFFYSMLLYFSQDTPPPESLLEIKFRELILNILTDPANAPMVNYITQLDQYDKPFLPDVMESNYMYNLSLAEFARISNRSLAAFKRDFQKHFQLTPGKWLLQKRVEHAHTLLTTTRASIQEVAMDSGFESVVHFSRVFKERYGRPPSHSRA